MVKNWGTLLGQVAFYPRVTKRIFLFVVFNFAGAKNSRRATEKLKKFKKICSCPVLQAFILKKSCLISKNDFGFRCGVVKIIFEKERKRLSSFSIARVNTNNCHALALALGASRSSFFLFAKKIKKLSRKIVRCACKIKRAGRFDLRSALKAFQVFLR